MSMKTLAKLAIPKFTGKTDRRATTLTQTPEHAHTTTTHKSSHGIALGKKYIRLLSPWKTIAPQTLLGVEITASTVTLTQLSHNGARYRVDACTQAQFSDDATLTAALKHALDSGLIHATQACLGLEHTAVAFKTVELDASLSAADYELHISEHASQYFHYPRDELLLDFEIVGKSLQHPRLLTLRWVAARKAAVQAKIAALQAAGLIVSIVDIHSYALQRIACLASRNQDTNTCIMALYVRNHHLLLVAIDQQRQVIYCKEERLYPQQDISAEILRNIHHCQNNTNVPISQILLAAPQLTDEMLATIATHTGIDTQDMVRLLLAHAPIELGDYLNLADYLVSFGLALRVKHGH